MCDAKTDENGSGNVLEGAKVITLQELYDQLKHKRDLILQFMINDNIEPRKVNYRALIANLAKDRTK